MIYLDHAATAPLLAEAWQEMEAVYKHVHGNASSMHRAGREAKALLTKAREKTAKLLGASGRDVFFTAGATEANNWAVKAATTLAASQGKHHIITSRIEHPSVLTTCAALTADDFEVTELVPDREGRIDPGQLSASLRPDTGFVSVQWVNQEIGSIQDVQAIGRICREQSILFHTDAVQAVTHIEVDWRHLPVDFLTLSAHKFGGPKGVGALLARQERGHAIELAPFIYGGRQERGRRAGTENLAGITGMASALEAAVSGMKGRELVYGELAGLLLERLNEYAVDFVLHGARTGDANDAGRRRLSSILNIYFPGVEGQTLLLMLDRSGVAVSLGSACEAGSTEPSHVLAALGLYEAEAASSIRISMGVGTTAGDIEETAAKMRDVVFAIIKNKRDI